MLHDTEVAANGVTSWEQAWQPTFYKWTSEQMAAADSGHGIDHVQRVVENAKRLGLAEQANPAVFLPAAWLHDCVSVAKNSPQRSLASRLAAKAASEFLESIDYPSDLIPAVVHCIEAHSFSANIPCESMEAKVVQDSDRLEAVGAIGLARCLMTGGSMRQRLYHPDSPFPIDRPAMDNVQSVDHFFAKLLGLHKTMQTDAGRAEARQRTEFLISFLKQLGYEIGYPVDELDRLIQSC
jgi:uncharacterized protein